MLSLRDVVRSLLARLGEAVRVVGPKVSRQGDRQHRKDVTQREREEDEGPERERESRALVKIFKFAAERSVRLAGNGSAHFRAGSYAVKRLWTVSSALDRSLRNSSVLVVPKPLIVESYVLQAPSTPPAKP